MDKIKKREDIKILSVGAAVQDVYLQGTIFDPKKEHKKMMVTQEKCGRTMLDVKMAVAHKNCGHTRNSRRTRKWCHNHGLYFWV